MLQHAGTSIPCLIGKGGAVSAEAKREGDGATPLGKWPIRAALLQPDRISAFPLLNLPWRWLRSQDGWCDDPQDVAYNRPVQHPYAKSAERLWRDDGVYDVIILLGHNDSPPVSGRGSAIFLHCTAASTFTEGCIAVAKDHLLGLLPSLSAKDTIEIC
jgi:L,D-peptidoglycan transpeptidase YkuD (ErfK/YbiS/YcfS/YnhG family)